MCFSVKLENFNILLQMSTFQFLFYLWSKLFVIPSRHFFCLFLKSLVGCQVQLLLTMGVSTVETNRDRDRDCPSCRDQFLKPVKIFSTVEINFYFISVEIFKIETLQSRLCCVEIFVEIIETHRDCRDTLRLLRFVEMQSRFVDKSRRENTKSMHFSIEIETNCRETPKFSDLDEFLNLHRDFLV